LLLSIGEFSWQGVVVASIIVISGSRKGDFYRLGERTNVIGRDEALPIQIVDNRVSRKHAEIRFDRHNWSYSAADMDSKNGVLINGVRINKETLLTDGDCITIGNTALMFTLKDFFDRKSALAHVKRLGEREHPTKGD
jgi:pSer/pThr/pTyr-binding forkhead associated (FHA) protein